MRFYGFFRSSSAYRCRIAFNLKGLEYDFQPVHLRRNGGEQNDSAYLHINPQGLVPSLDIGGDIITQSLAIIEWLEENYPEPALLPSTSIERSQVRAFAYSIACEIHPLQNLRVLQYLGSEYKQDESARRGWCAHWISEGLRACEETLKRGPQNTKFSFGDTPSLADIVLAPQIYSANRFGVDIESMPRIIELWDIYESLEAFADAHPKNQMDFEP